MIMMMDVQYIKIFKINLNKKIFEKILKIINMI